MVDKLKFLKGKVKEYIKFNIIINFVAFHLLLSLLKYLRYYFNNFLNFSQYVVCTYLCIRRFLGKPYIKINFNKIKAVSLITNGFYYYISSKYTLSIFSTPILI